MVGAAWLTVPPRATSSSPTLSIAFLASTVAAALTLMLLLAAAVVRRLPDRARRGFWALVPAALLLTSIGLIAPMFVTPDPVLFLTAFATGLLSFIALGLLVVQLALPTPTARRHTLPSTGPQGSLRPGSGR